MVDIAPGAYAEIWNGHIDLAGQFVVADGSFDADVCLDGIQMNQILPMGEPGSALDEWLSVRMSTTRRAVRTRPCWLAPTLTVT